MPEASAESTEINTDALSALPDTLEGATTVIRRLGYRDAVAWAVEPDRIAMVYKKAAWTLCFQFDHDAGEVRISKVEGWPVD